MNYAIVTVQGGATTVEHEQNCHVFIFDLDEAEEMPTDQVQKLRDSANALPISKPRRLILEHLDALLFERVELEHER